VPPLVLLQHIDGLLAPDHVYLESTDYCYFLREYTPGGFEKSATNDLILNLKKDLRYRGHAPWKYKLQAIDQCARELRDALSQYLDGTWVVPIPPSKCRTHPGYDDRLVQVADQLCARTTANRRDLLLQRSDTEPLHLKNDSPRPQPHEIARNYQIDETQLAGPVPSAIWILDDVLTTGSHFKAAQMVVHQRLPGIAIYGIFIARRRPLE
jgi:hypothetical protein